MDLRLVHPFACILAGPSQSGKSVWAKKFIDNLESMCTVKFKQIVWHYGEWQPTFESASNIIFKQGLPNCEDFDGLNTTLLIIDDLMRESDGRIVDIFTKGCHHRNLSVLYLTQNLFHQAKGQRDISLNTSYIVYFKNPRDQSQISFLARQISPDNPKYVLESYMDATERSHGYLFFDLRQNTPMMFRLRTNILPGEPPSYCYIPKKKYKFDSTYCALQNGSVRA